MGGRGPAPKPSDRRARRNADIVALRVIHAEPVAQPELPEGIDWHKQTREWWQMWRDSPLSTEFTSTDWSELLDTALLHTWYWEGELKLAGELRLRVAKFGATPEDRARLRITFAQADQAEERVPTSIGSARERRAGIRRVV